MGETVPCCKSHRTRDHCLSLMGVDRCLMVQWPHTSSTGKQNNALTPVMVSIRRSEWDFLIHQNEKSPEQHPTSQARRCCTSPAQERCIPPFRTQRPCHMKWHLLQGSQLCKKNRWLGKAASSGLHSLCLLILLFREVTGR